MSIQPRKNELEKLQEIFSNYKNYEYSMSRYFDHYKGDAAREFTKDIREQIEGFRKIINQETLNIPTNDIKSYVSQYLIKLNNLIDQITKYTLFAYNRDEKIGVEKKNKKDKDISEDLNLNFTYHLDWGLVISLDYIRKITIKIISDYDFLFDSLEKREFGEDGIPDILQGFNIKINDFKTGQKGQEMLTITKIKWTKSAMDFAAYFQPLILKGVLQLNNKSDAEPIVELLHKIFEISSEKDGTQIKIPTLQKYFKDAKRDAP